MGTLDAEWKINDHVTLENKFRASNSLLNYIGTIPENPSASGATAPYSSTLTFFSGYVQLNAQSRYEPVNVINDQPQITFKFNTGQIQHTAILGGEFSNERISIQGYSGLTSELTTGPCRLRIEWSADRQRLQSAQQYLRVRAPLLWPEIR